MCERTNSSAVQTTGTLSVSGQRRRSSFRINNNATGANHEQNSDSPIQEKTIVECATRIQRSAGRKNAQAANQAMKYRERGRKSARTRTSPGTSANHAIQPCDVGKYARFRMSDESSAAPRQRSAKPLQIGRARVGKEGRSASTEEEEE